jgi:hypothetical protein
MSFSVLNKLTLIANLAFLAALGMRYYPVLQGTKLESSILVTGLVLSVLLNISWLIALAWRRFVRRLPAQKNVLIFLNLMIILVQFIMILTGILQLTEASL